jgi:hypothetical protein
MDLWSVPWSISMAKQNRKLHLALNYVRHALTPSHGFPAIASALHVKSGARHNVTEEVFERCKTMNLTRNSCRLLETGASHGIICPIQKRSEQTARLAYCKRTLFRVQGSEFRTLYNIAVLNSQQDGLDSVPALRLDAMNGDISSSRSSS